ncbi:MAG: DegT/DnrJ/EryC1/StrS aminotransferase family protein [Treponema sp.]|nr:DegT/DnrJ/EryC1/StrS aminotransferase family protein [Treponema sp.]
MIQTYSTTIRRKEMDAVLTCMVDEKIGPGELNARLTAQVKEFFKCDGSTAFRSPSIALKYALMALDVPAGSKVAVSALAPAWQYQSLVSMNMVPVVLDVREENGLVSVEDWQKAVNDGAKVILLHETEGILPEIEEICKIGVPVIEDISMSAGSSVACTDENGNELPRKKAGLFGVFTILGLEERDVITAGGGAVLMAPGRRDWIVLKKLCDEAPLTDLLPDINAALAWVQLKEFNRNETARKEIFNLYHHSCMIGRHKMLVRDMDEGSTMSCFPLVLSSPFKDVKQYAAKKDIEIRQAFEGSIIDLKMEELSESCIRAKSLLLRTAHFPLYPRLTHNESAKISKVLGTLP